MESVAIVVAGAGARGGYEAGALSVLVPRLRTAGVNISMYVGTSAGAINATIFAAFSHLPPDEQAACALNVWHDISVGNVFRSPIVTSPAVALRFAGQMLRVPGARLTSLLDTEPLWRMARRKVDWNQLRKNIDNEELTLAVVTTSGSNNRTVVFIDRPGDAPPPYSDVDRPIDYVHAPIGPEHVLASAAIPIVFPPVRLDGPDGFAGWYVDGGVRLNAPLKPALSLGAKKLVVVATHPKDDSQSAPQPNPAPPDVDDMVVRLLDAALVDRMVEDLRTLRHINELVELVTTQQSPTGAPRQVTTASGPREVIPYLFVGPQKRESLANLADRVFRQRHWNAKSVGQLLREVELRALGHAFAGDGPRRGDLFSYMYFDQDFINASIEEGKRDAHARLAGLPADQVAFQTE
jgi:NTE family protein